MGKERQERLGIKKDEAAKTAEEKLFGEEQQQNKEHEQPEQKEETGQPEPVKQEEFIEMPEQPEEKDAQIDNEIVHFSSNFLKATDFHSDFQKKVNALNPNELDALEKQSDLTAGFLTCKSMQEMGLTEISAYYIEKSPVPDQVSGETKMAAFLKTKHGDFFCLSTVVISAIDKVTAEAPFPIRIVSNGMKKGDKYTYWDVKVYQL